MCVAEEVNCRLHPRVNGRPIAAVAYTRVLLNTDMSGAEQIN